jgi:hypothetical protein
LLKVRKLFEKQRDLRDFKGEIIFQLINFAKKNSQVIFFKSNFSLQKCPSSASMKEKAAGDFDLLGNRQYLTTERF